MQYSSYNKSTQVRRLVSNEQSLFEYGNSCVFPCGNKYTVLPFRSNVEKKIIFQIQTILYIPQILISFRRFKTPLCKQDFTVILQLIWVMSFSTYGISRDTHLSHIVNKRAFINHNKMLQMKNNMVELYNIDYTQISIRMPQVFTLLKYMNFA